MVTGSPEQFRYLSDVDVDEQLVDEVLERIRNVPNVLRFSQADWDRLREQRPNLHFFISQTSLEAAPDDPLQREAVSAALLGMLVLAEEIGLKSEEDRMSTFIDGNFGDLYGDLFVDPEPPAA